MPAAVPRVAVVIVSYRSAALVIECLRSLVHEQASPDIQLNAIVVDNASGDFATIASAISAEGWHSWATVIEAPRNGGFGYGNNFGIAHAWKKFCPDYFHLLNPDTLVRPHAATRLVDFLERNPTFGIAGSSFENTDGSDWPIAFRFPSLTSEVEAGVSLGILTRLLSRWKVPQTMSAREQRIDWGSGASLMVRRKVLESVGGLDENFFLYFEETEFCWRATHAGFPVAYVPQSRIVHIGGGSTGASEHDGTRRRLPAYWFESRRYYFVVTCGPARAMAIDIAALIAYSLGTLRLIVQGRRNKVIPHYVADLWRFSVLHPRNRRPSKPQIPRYPDWIPG